MSGGKISKNPKRVVADHKKRQNSTFMITTRHDKGLRRQTQLLGGWSRLLKVPDLKKINEESL